MDEAVSLLSCSSRRFIIFPLLWEHVAPGCLRRGFTARHRFRLAPAVCLIFIPSWQLWRRLPSLCAWVSGCQWFRAYFLVFSTFLAIQVSSILVTQRWCLPSRIRVSADRARRFLFSTRWNCSWCSLRVNSRVFSASGVYARSSCETERFSYFVVASIGVFWRWSVPSCTTVSLVVLGVLWYSGC